MMLDIHNFARIGIVLSQAFPYCAESPRSYIDALDNILCDEYFELVEIGQMPFESLNAEVPKMIRQAHMVFTYSGHSRLFARKLNLNALDEGARRAAVAEMMAGLDEASSLGAEGYQFLSGRYEEDSIPQALDALCKSITEISLYARRCGMPVALEIFDHNIDKKSLLGPVDRVMAVADRVLPDCDNFGFMVDCSHIPMIGESLDQNLDPLRGIILHAHMGNTMISDPDDVAYGDKHPRFGYPGSENDTTYLKRFLEKLLDLGYLHKGGANPLSFEVRPMPGENPAAVLAGSKRALNAAWRAVANERFSSF